MRNTEILNSDETVVQAPKADDDWDLSISREEWNEIMEWDEIMQGIEDEKAALETIAEEEDRKRKKKQRRSRDYLNSPYILDSYGISYEDLKKLVDLYE